MEKLSKQSSESSKTPASIGQELSTNLTTESMQHRIYINQGYKSDARPYFGGTI